MFGGDWPVCTLAATYKQWVEALKKIVEDRNRGGTAEAVPRQRGEVLRTHMIHRFALAHHKERRP